MGSARSHLTVVEALSCTAWGIQHAAVSEFPETTVQGCILDLAAETYAASDVAAGVGVGVGAADDGVWKETGEVEEV